ncbi:hypothetical protein JNUCC83_04170 [Vagococcus sp. JNUCC 83]
MKKRILITTFASLLLLSGCGSNKNTATTKSTESSQEIAENTAEKNANAILGYVYDGKSTDVKDVTNQTKEELDQYIIGQLKEKQLENYNPDNKLDDYYLIIDGSEYYASEILEDYAKAYLKTTHSLGEYKIKNITTTNDEAQVTAEITPYAGLSEANPIGTMRTELFGGIDEEEFIRQ